MKFYNRTDELQQLSDIKERSLNSSQMTMIIGRRRIGKTRLIIQSLKNEDFLYFFVTKKNEPLLCEEFANQVKETLKIPIYGIINTFKELFSIIMETAKKKPVTLVVDEFQVFQSVNPAIYGEIQSIWDRNKDETRLNMILCGSIYSLMKKVFEHSKEPLFGRLTDKIHLQNFHVNVIKEILYENNPSAGFYDLLALYVITGGVPKYIEQFVDKKKLNLENIFDEIFRPNSLFLDEGKNQLIEDFGKDYTNYFSILSLIASAKTSRQAIESILQKDIGGYLDRLENDYGIIKKRRPILAKPGSRLIRYYIDDNFLNFWFCFIYKNRSSLEISNYKLVKEIVRRDFDTYSGRFLEKYFIEKLAASNEYSKIGNYWEKGNQNEIDIVAVDKRNLKVLFAEVKMNKTNININKLRQKSTHLTEKFQGYHFEYKGFSIDDM